MWVSFWSTVSNSEKHGEFNPPPSRGLVVANEDWRGLKMTNYFLSCFSRPVLSSAEDRGERSSVDWSPGFRPFRQSARRQEPNRTAEESARSRFKLLVNLVNDDQEIVCCWMIFIVAWTNRGCHHLIAPTLDQTVSFLVLRCFGSFLINKQG